MNLERPCFSSTTRQHIQYVQSCMLTYTLLMTTDVLLGSLHISFHRFQQLRIETVLRDKGTIESEG